MTTDSRSEAGDAALEREHDSTEDTAADAALNAMADANHRANYDAAAEDDKEAEPVTFFLPLFVYCFFFLTTQIPRDSCRINKALLKI